MTPLCGPRALALLLGLLLAACASAPRQAAVQERSPVIAREALPPVLPRAATAPAGPPASAKPGATTPPRNAANAGMTPPKAVAAAEDPVATASPLRPEGAPPASVAGTPAARQRANGSAPAGVGSAAPLPALDWAWPVDAAIAQPFSEARKGIDFAGNLGDPVRAAAGGTVTYVGNSLRGYGRMVVVTHDKGYLSVYAHNRQILVKEGDRVERGQKIAEMGHTDSNEVVLHFELRHQGRALDPARILPAR